MRTTLKDIARYLNVSTTTVSRAMNDKDDISLEMRQKVLETARLLDYKPNSVAISLRKKTASKLIGVIIPVLDHYFFSTILRGITAPVDNHDYMIMIGESNHDVDKEKELINKFSDHYVAGVIFIPSRNKKSSENLSLLQRRQTPFILIDRIFENYNGSYIQHDDYHGAYHATQHLINRGCTKIAMLRGSDECTVSQARLSGFVAAIDDASLEVNPDYIQSCIQASKKEGYNATRVLVEKSNPPDAIFCITDHLAAGVLEYANEHNIQVPQQLSVVGYSNSEISENLSPKLTTVAQDGYEMGRVAKEYLIQLFHHKKLVQQKIFPSELIIRESS